MNKEDNNIIKKRKVHHTMIPPMINSIVIEVVLFTLVIGLFSIFSEGAGLLFGLARVFIIFTFVFVNIVLLVYLYNRINSYYVISKDAVLYIKTFLFRKSEKFYTLNENADLKLRQGVFGRLFNYGTIEIVGPTIEEAILLKSISKPHKAMDSLVDLISKLETSDVFVES